MVSIGAVRGSGRVGAALLVAVVFGASAFGLQGCGDRGSAEAAGGSAADGSTDTGSAAGPQGPSYTLDPSEAPRDAVLSRLEVGVMETLEPVFGSSYTASDRASLAKAYGEAMGLYLYGTADDYLASLDVSPESKAEHADSFRRQWEQGSSIVSSSPLDPEGVSADFVMVGGERAEDKPRLGALMIEGSRANKGGIGDPRAMGLDVVEIAVPIRLNPLKGDSIDGRVGLSFAFDPTRGEWVLIGTCVATDEVNDHLLALPL